MDREQVIEKVKSVSKNGRISCRQALALAQELGIPPKEMGDILNEIKVKIASCQLGCFP